MIKVKALLIRRRKKTAVTFLFFFYIFKEAPHHVFWITINLTDDQIYISRSKFYDARIFSAFALASFKYKSLSEIVKYNDNHFASIKTSRVIFVVVVIEFEPDQSNFRFVLFRVESIQYKNQTNYQFIVFYVKLI